MLLALAGLLITLEQHAASVQGEGAMLLLEHSDNATFTATSFLLDRRETVQWARNGTVIVDSQYAGGNTARARNFAEQFGLRVLATDAPPAAAFELHRPRVAVVRSRWVEWLLNEYKVPFTPIEGGAGLRTRFDSIVLAGASTMDSLATFVREGGTLVAIGDGARFAIRNLALPVTVTSVAGASAHFDVTHPVAFGMPAEATIFGAVMTFDVKGAARPVATLGNAAVLLDYPLGRGRVLLFGFEPQYRGEAHNTFRLLLNAVYWASSQRL